MQLQQNNAREMFTSKKFNQLHKNGGKNFRSLIYSTVLMRSRFFDILTLNNNNGNAVPMRSSSFLTVGTAFPSVPLEMALALALWVSARPWRCAIGL